METEMPAAKKPKLKPMIQKTASWFLIGLPDQDGNIQQCSAKMKPMSGAALSKIQNEVTNIDPRKVTADINKIAKPLPEDFYKELVTEDAAKNYAEAIEKFDKYFKIPVAEDGQELDAEFIRHAELVRQAKHNVLDHMVPKLGGTALYEHMMKKIDTALGMIQNNKQIQNKWIEDVSEKVLPGYFRSCAADMKDLYFPNLVNPDKPFKVDRNCMKFIKRDSPEFEAVTQVLYDIHLLTVDIDPDIEEKTKKQCEPSHWTDLVFDEIKVHAMVNAYFKQAIEDGGVISEDFLLFIGLSSSQLQKVCNLKQTGHLPNGWLDALKELYRL